MSTQAPEFHLTLDENSTSNFSPNKSGALTWNVPSGKGKDEPFKHNHDPNKTDKSFSIAKNLAEIKLKRKLMESNAQLLFNRLQALSQEEHRLKKNASDLKKKSYELLNHRVSRDLNKGKDEQELNKREKLKTIHLSKLRNTVEEARHKAKLEVEKTKNLVIEKRRREAEEIRAQRIIHAEKIIIAKNQHIDGQRAKSLKVKEAEEKSVAKIQQYHQVKSELMRHERAKEIQAEEERILLKEREVQKLGLQEDVMLQVLTKAEENEDRAQTEYNDISKLPVNELVTKYGFYLKAPQSGHVSPNKSITDTENLHAKSLSYSHTPLHSAKSSKFFSATLKPREPIKRSLFN